MIGVSQRSYWSVCCTAAVAAFCMGCSSASTGNSPTVRSPALDYQQPSTSTASGRSLGADRTAPGDKLEQGPRVGVDSRLEPNGTLAPGWDADEQGLSYEERRRVGGATHVQPKTKQP
jgi:hypothetical protein